MLQTYALEDDLSANVRRRDAGAFALLLLFLFLFLWREKKQT